MSRYYDIQVAGHHWTSHPSGKMGRRDPGALNIELDITQSPGDAPAGTGFLRVWGVGLALIQKANQFANQPIIIKGGMGTGLPLCNPSQAGAIATGTINKYFGNYEGVNQSIDFQISASGYGQLTTKTPGINPTPPVLNGTLNWLKGQPLARPLQQTLQQMFPKAQIVMRISNNIVAPQDIIGYHANLYQLASIIRRVSQQILGFDKPGVSIIPMGNKVVVDDASQSPPAGQINYTDLIGQPTWIDIATIQVKCVMRADIDVGETITLPQNVIVTGQQSSGIQTNQGSLQGTFNVHKVRHVGNFRQPDGASWVTIIEAWANKFGSTVGQ